MSPILKIKERIVGPRGLFNLDNEWYGYVDEFKYTIGLPGLRGFGVGCCRPELLPADIVALPGTYDRFSPTYGNYLHTPSASVVCYLPAHYIDIQSPGNTNAPFFGSKVVISSTQSGNSVLAKAFKNGGSDLAGVFIDKYQGSNVKPDGSGQPNSSTSSRSEFPSSGGIFASRPLLWPVSATAVSASLRSPFSLCDSTVLNPSATAPTNNLGGVWALCRTRGADWHPVPIWTRVHLAFLSLAHSQALLNTSGVPVSSATTSAAWMDTAPYAPKGNNNTGSDVNNSDVSFGGLGWAGEQYRAYTGAARIGDLPAVEQTTHNGQLCGIADVNGNQQDICPGLTNTTGGGEGYVVFSEDDDWSEVNSNSDIVSSDNLIELLPDSDPATGVGIWWTDANQLSYLKPDNSGTYHPSSTWAGSETRRYMTWCGLPRQEGTGTTQTSTNIFGGDGFNRIHTSGCVPAIGGRWTEAGSAGVFATSLAEDSTFASQYVGARAIRFNS